MTHWVKCLPDKHEDLKVLLFLTPVKKKKKSRVQYTHVRPSSQQKHKNPRDLLLASKNELMTSVINRLCFSHLSNREIGNNFQKVL